MTVTSITITQQIDKEGEPHFIIHTTLNDDTACTVSFYDHHLNFAIAYLKSQMVHMSCLPSSSSPKPSATRN